jgi:hypothetical protein
MNERAIVYPFGPGQQGDRVALPVATDSGGWLTLSLPCVVVWLRTQRTFP